MWLLKDSSETSNSAPPSARANIVSIGMSCSQIGSQPSTATRPSISRRVRSQSAAAMVGRSRAIPRYSTRMLLARITAA